MLYIAERSVLPTTWHLSTLLHRLPKIIRVKKPRELRIDIDDMDVAFLIIPYDRLIEGAGFPVGLDIDAQTAVQPELQSVHKTQISIPSILLPPHFSPPHPLQKQEKNRNSHHLILPLPLLPTPFHPLPLHLRQHAPHPLQLGRQPLALDLQIARRLRDPELLGIQS